MERKKLWLLPRSNEVDLKEMDGECGPGLADGFGFMSRCRRFGGTGVCIPQGEDGGVF